MKKDNERLKTLSKNFYDDEIEFIADNGDIYLKEGVKRMNYPSLSSDNIGSQINYIAKAMDKIKDFKHRNRNWDDGD